MRFVVDNNGTLKSVQQIISESALEQCPTGRFDGPGLTKFAMNVENCLGITESDAFDDQYEYHFDVKDDVGIITRSGFYRAEKLIFCVMENADKNAGNGPMVPRAYFDSMRPALSYMNELPGVQGRQHNWIFQPHGDVQIEVLPVFTDTMSCHKALDIPMFDQKGFKKASDLYVARCRALETVGLDSSFIPKPEERNFEHKATRRFI